MLRLPARSPKLRSSVHTAPLDIAALVTALSSLFETLRRRRKVKAIEDELAQTQKDLRECKVKHSSLETEMVTVRKLLPGGEWFIKLGLDKYP